MSIFSLAQINNNNVLLFLDRGKKLESYKQEYRGSGETVGTDSYCTKHLENTFLLSFHPCMSSKSSAFSLHD